MSAARLKFYVQPRASKTEVAGMHADSLRIRLAAPPLDNAANDALVAFVAAQLGLSRRCVRIVAGITNRRKVLEIDGVDAGAAREALLALAKQRT